MTAPADYDDADAPLSQSLYPSARPPRHPLSPWLKAGIALFLCATSYAGGVLSGTTINPPAVSKNETWQRGFRLGYDTARHDISAEENMSRK